MTRRAGVRATVEKHASEMRKQNPAHAQRKRGSGELGTAIAKAAANNSEKLPRIQRAVRLMILFYRAFSVCGPAGSQVLSHEQGGQQSGAGGHCVDEDVLVLGMRAVADGAEAVQRRDTYCGREIAIRAAACRAFSERQTHLRG